MITPAPLDDFICDELRAAVEDPTVALIYDPNQRQVAVVAQCSFEGLPMVLVNRLGLSGMEQEIGFCPFTGRAFPGSLGDRWCNTLERTYKIDPYEVDIPVEAFPSEMMTEEWWRKRRIGRTSEVFKPGWRRPRHIPGAVIIPTRHPPRETCERPAYLIGDEYRCKPGYVRPVGHPPHMCDELAFLFGDMRVMIAYLPHVREYGIRRLDVNRKVDFQPIEILPIRYCPGCGCRLPKSLRPQWEQALAEMGLNPDSPDIPDNYRTELWWRGIRATDRPLV